MKTQINFFSLAMIVILLSINLYATQFDSLESITISKANALLFIATKDKGDKTDLTKGAKYVYRQAKRSGDKMLIEGTFKAYIKAQKQEQQAEVVYENAKKVQSDLERALKGRTLSQLVKSLEDDNSGVNISYLEKSFDETSKSQSNFWGFVAKLFNLNLDKDRQAYTNQSLSDISFEVTLNENIHDYHSKNITITAQKTIFQW